MLTRFPTILVLAGMASATISNQYRLACQAVEAAISNASGVYYPGERE